MVWVVGWREEEGEEVRTGAAVAVAPTAIVVLVLVLGPVLGLVVALVRTDRSAP